MRTSFVLLFSLLSVATSAIAQDVSSSIREALEPFVKDGEISGAVTLVARNGKIVSHEAIGKSDLDTGRTMQKDDLFWIASMTKPIVGVAAMMLVDEGKLDVHEKVETYLPEVQGLLDGGRKIEDILVSETALPKDHASRPGNPYRRHSRGE